MSTYAEFRLAVSPDLNKPGTWDIAVLKCPVPGLVGPKGSVTPQVTRDDLLMLRSRDGWPNSGNLQKIGRAVWQSVLSSGAEAALEASRQVLALAPESQGLRIVVVLQGHDDEPRNPGGIQLSELPVEALYSDTEYYLATDPKTPISRSFQPEPDRPPERVSLPLRVLVAIASPSDKPQAKIAEEAGAIRNAVKDLTADGSLEIDFLETATVSSVSTQLGKKPYHVFHFIGHGGFDYVGDLATPRAHLCFVRTDRDTTDPVDAELLTVMLKSSSVRLLVITACSSATPLAPVPEQGDENDEGPLGTKAFEGVAQRTVAGLSGVSAAVAMQFDLEEPAAVLFSRVFYENLLKPDVALDEVVTRARQQIALEFEPGHRAWITPAVYWRCQDGHVFEIESIAPLLSAETLAALQKVDSQLVNLRTILEKFAAVPEPQRAAMESQWLQWVGEAEKLLDDRAGLCPETLWIRGTRANAGNEAVCRLSLRVRGPATVKLIQFRLEFPSDKLTFAGSEMGADTDIPPAAAVLGDGTLYIMLADPKPHQPGNNHDYELGFLKFALSGAAPSSLVDLRITRPEVTTVSGQRLRVTTTDGLMVIL